MGLCFISEGAIPFAAADPARVLPACILGSAVSGCLSMMFGCTLAGLQSGARRKTACTDYPIQDSLGDGIVDDVYEHPAGDAEGLRLEIHGYSSSRCAQASDRG